MEYQKPEFDDVKRGEIYYIGVDDNSESIGSEQCNHDRPAIIVSNDIGNLHSGIVQVVYLTTQPKKDLPTHVDIYTTSKKSTALCEQINTISKYKLRRYVNQCTQKEMEEINMALLISLGLSTAKGVVKHMDTWAKAYTEHIDESDTEKMAECSAIPEMSEDEVIIGAVEHSPEDVAYLASLETKIQMYDKMYNDMFNLAKTLAGGSAND